MASLISISSMIIGSVGIFFGFYFISSDLSLAVKLVTLSTVGIVGTLAFVRHVIFHKDDAKRLGWETDRPDWMFEVGFANLAFGIIGIISVLFWETTSQALVLIGYSVYLFQAAILHGYRYFTDEVKVPARLWRSTILSLVYVGMMIYFAVASLSY